MDALILTLHADIEPEFQVHTQNLSRKAIDLVKTSTGRRIAIEFDNIKTACIKLGKGKVLESWQELTQVSRLLSEKSDEEILSLEISDKYRPRQKTVREVLEQKINVKKNEYLTPLRDRNDAELSCMFIVLREQQRYQNNPFTIRTELQEDLMEISPQITEASCGKDIPLTRDECRRDPILFESNADIGFTQALQNNDTSPSSKNVIEPAPKLCSKLDDLKKEGYYVSPGISINEAPNKKKKKEKGNVYENKPKKISKPQAMIRELSVVPISDELSITISGRNIHCLYCEVDDIEKKGDRTNRKSEMQV
ncbi:2153_t:CDS:2 [Diversispora eburnea]|uniref:2153_t:CDS:1 n=1 Tax=Diversispora eburnea TaxID=1213867 RepID=A0A9N9B2U4_9GLOM|nr:2153_t:CDS:2 [Diversispora eburnea]